MSDLTVNEDSQQERSRDLLKFLLIVLVVLVICGCPTFYCWVVPATTGQLCVDFMSGHVPPKAVDMFLERLFEATTVQDYEWLGTVSTETALEELKEIQPIVTQHYRVTGRDDLGGLYETEIRFDNEAVVYLIFHGQWPCPDFVVTEQEVFQRITLTHIERRE